MGSGRKDSQDRRYRVCLSLCQAIIKNKNVVAYDRLMDTMEKLGKEKLMDLVAQLTLEKGGERA